MIGGVRGPDQLAVELVHRPRRGDGARRAPRRPAPRTARPPAIPAAAARADQRRTSPISRQTGIRGTMPRRAYSAFEIGCAASVHMPQVWIPLSSGSSGPGTAGPPGSTSRAAWARSISACPTPDAWTPGRTKSMARNHSPSRRVARREPGHRPLAVHRHPEPVRVRRQRVGQEPAQRCQVVGHRRLRQPRLVVLDRRLPGQRAGVEVPVAAGAVRHRDARATSPATGYSSPSSAEGGRPVARRSSSACMNRSRSPSRTAPVFDVSWPVRRSLTIWYGCST